ncbi:MAG: hypothetical protein IPN96_08145 [Anaerolineales bacterium]|nr:hypothetical protein [Anaerolineales bacterium]
MNKLNKNHLWYLATVFGFAIGFVIGGDVLRPSHPWAGPWLEPIFWAFPAGGAGLGMGLAQWVLIHYVHKKTFLFLWIPATTIGVVGITGGALLLALVVSAFFEGSLSAFFMNFEDWFVPWVKLLTIISPVAIIIGAVFQWLFVRHVTKNHSFKELLKMGMEWISAFIMLFIMFGILEMLVQSHNDILNYFVAVAATTPSGLIFAYSTIDILRNPLSESHSL